MHLPLLARVAPLVLLALCACGSQNGDSATRNGETIFQTGRDAGGAQIVSAKPPLKNSCAACHRADGSGGVHLPGNAMSADLRHPALTTKQKIPYTVATLERAISTGVDNLGKPLDPVMPHWTLSQQDLHDVATYVYTQLK